MNDYFHKIKSLVEELRSADNKVSEDELVMYLMEGLGPEYDAVIVNITSRKERLPLHKVYAMLVSHENKVLKNLSATNVNITLAFIVNYEYSGYNNHKRRNWRTGNSQGQHLHFQVQYGQSSEGKEKEKYPGEKENKPTCQICFKVGHEAFKCWNRFNRKFVQRAGDRNYQRSAYGAASEIITDPS